MFLYIISDMLLPMLLQMAVLRHPWKGQKHLTNYPSVPGWLIPPILRNSSLKTARRKVCHDDVLMLDCSPATSFGGGGGAEYPYWLPFSECRHLFHRQKAPTLYLSSRKISCILNNSCNSRLQNRNEWNDQESIQLSHTSHQRHQRERNTNTK